MYWSELVRFLKAPCGDLGERSRGNYPKQWAVYVGSYSEWEFNALRALCGADSSPLPRWGFGRAGGGAKP